MPFPDDFCSISISSVRYVVSRSVRLTGEICISLTKEYCFQCFRMCRFSNNYGSVVGFCTFILILPLVPLKSVCGFFSVGGEYDYLECHDRLSLESSGRVVASFSPVWNASRDQG